MTKLYKTIRGRVHYWEAWKRDSKLWVHTGLLGHHGRVTKVAIKPRESEAAAIKRCAAVPIAEGYAPITKHQLLVVQYPHALAGDADGQDFREDFFRLLNNRLGWIGNGACYQGDAGRTTMNMLCDVVDPALATKPLVADLRKAKLIAGVVIATRAGRSWKVLWPVGSKKKFTLA